MTDFEKSLLDNMQSNGTQLSEILDYLNSNTATANATTQQNVSTSVVETNNKGGDINVKNYDMLLDEMDKRIKKQEDTIKAMQQDNIYSESADNNIQSFEDIIFSEYINPMMGGK